MVNALRIHPTDNVAVALRDLPADTPLAFADGESTLDVCTRQDIPFGHKIALRAIAAGDEVIKYGARIGLANAPVQAGEHVHVHNLSSVRGAAR